MSLPNNPETVNHVIQIIQMKGDHPYIGTGLILAGFLPMSFFSSNTLQAIYFLLLIPPAAWHCYLWVKKSLIPEIKKIVERRDE